MKQIAAHLKSASMRIANVWLLEDSGGRRFLIDTGHPIERLSLLGQLWAAGVRMPGDLTAVLLTHRHADHAGNAAFLRKRFGARVICHENDAGVLSGKTLPPRMLRDRGEQAVAGRQRFYERWLCAYEDRAPAFSDVDEVFEEGAWRWGFQVIPVPGHTEGSIMLYHEPTATLFSGDAILVGLPVARFLKVPRFAQVGPLRRASRSKALRLAEPGFSQDAASCHLAVRRFLKRLPQVETLCSGHGPVITEGATARLQKLLKESAEGSLSPP
jgi:glyoxylase-like metal-dependent hydrolase (beta-lactamase superfamily II)